VQRSSRCTAEPGPIEQRKTWAPDQQRTADALRSIRGTSRYRLEIQLIDQIAPIRIELLDQSYLPSAAPAFQGMFSRTSFKDGIERFKIDQLVDLVFACEAGNQLGLMFQHPTRQIVGDADVQRPISLACEYVDKEHHVHR
jgi:hypothetical protein